MIRSMIAGLCLSVAASAAQAQQPTVRPYSSVVQSSASDALKRQNTMIRVTLGMNFMLTGVGDPISDDSKLRDRTRRNVYQIALRECDLLIEMIASDCRIESVTFNTSRNPQLPDSVNVTANIALRATPK